MDNTPFNDPDTVPALPRETLDRMTEVALSFRQQSPANENRSRFRLFTPWRSGAVAMAACALLTFGLFFGQGVSDQESVTGTETQVAGDLQDDAYAEFTEFVLMDTLESF